MPSWLTSSSSAHGSGRTPSKSTTSTGSSVTPNPASSSPKSSAATPTLPTPTTSSSSSNTNNNCSSSTSSPPPSSELIHREIDKRRGKSATYTQPFRRQRPRHRASENGSDRTTPAISSDEGFKEEDRNGTEPNEETAATPMPQPQAKPNTVCQDFHDHDDDDDNTTTAGGVLDQDVQSFLTEFYYGGGIFAAMPDMQQLLRDYPDTLAVHYANLVPRTVSFDQFWSRYYYQCSATTILHEWRIEQQEQEQERLFEQEQNDSTIEFYNMDNNNTDAQPSGNKSNTGSGGAVDGGDSSSNPLLLEDQTAARAQIFYEESVSDIIETIPEQNEKNENDNDDDGENLDNSNDDGCFYNVAIGLAEHGIQE